MEEINAEVGVVRGGRQADVLWWRVVVVVEVLCDDGKEKKNKLINEVKKLNVYFKINY